MDNALDKLGLYDFFGVFLAGILIVGIHSFLKLPLFYSIDFNAENVNFVSFLVESYIVGMFYYEIGSLADNKLFKFRYKARTEFLAGNKVIKNELDLKDYRQMANSILKRDTNNSDFTAQDTEYVFFHCKNFIEILGKDDKISRLNSLYALNRTLMVAFFACTIAYLIRIISNIKSPNLSVMICFVILGILTILFCKRAQLLTKDRTRTILRYYKLLQEGALRPQLLS